MDSFSFCPLFSRRETKGWLQWVLCCSNPCGSTIVKIVKRHDQKQATFLFDPLHWKRLALQYLLFNLPTQRSFDFLVHFTESGSYSSLSLEDQHFREDFSENPRLPFFLLSVLLAAANLWFICVFRSRRVLATLFTDDPSTSCSRAKDEQQAKDHIANSNSNSPFSISFGLSSCSCLILLVSSLCFFYLQVQSLAISRCGPQSQHLFCKTLSREAIPIHLQSESSCTTLGYRNDPERDSIGTNHWRHILIGE